MFEIKDDKIRMIDRDIALLMEERQKRIDELTDPVRVRIRGIYENIAELFKELESLGDPAYHMESVYVGYDEHEEQKCSQYFEGKYFTYNAYNKGLIEEK